MGRIMKIEQNIPIPRRRDAGTSTYPFPDMNVGDSVFFEGQKTGGSAYWAAMSVGRRTGKMFVGRGQDGGLRVWRVA